MPQPLASIPSKTMSKSQIVHKLRVPFLNTKHSSVEKFPVHSRKSQLPSHLAVTKFGRVYLGLIGQHS